MKNLLEITDLHVTFKGRESNVEVLKGVNLQIGEGEVVGLVGESGCGKSQSARSILALLDVNAKIGKGHIHWLGNDITQASEKTMKRIRGNEIALMFQDPKSSLHPVLNIETQICECLCYHQSLRKKEAKQKCREVLSAVKIADVDRVMKSYPFQLSMGMCQRIMIAMAMVREAKLWIADEITSSLDVIVQAEILDLLKSIQQEKGIAILLITHDLCLLPSLCDRICVMEDGRIVESFKSEDLFVKGNHHPYTEKLISVMKNM